MSDAKEALAAAVAAAEGECRSGRGARCAGLEQREEAARQRVADARAKLVGLGAQGADDPGTQRIAALLSISADRYQQIAPALLGFGIAIGGEVDLVTRHKISALARFR